MSWSSKNAHRRVPKPVEWSTGTVHTREDGTVVHHQYEHRGYGWQHYVFVGTLEGITAEVEKVLTRYPPAGYGTSFNWPPGRKYLDSDREIEYEKPEQLGPDLWVLFGHHSNSCD